MGLPKFETFTAFYLNHFGDRKFMWVDLLPHADDSGKQHLGLDDKFKIARATPGNQVNVDDLEKYTHPCWCHPELIYADDQKGNEVWLHKRPQ